MILEVIGWGIAALTGLALVTMALAPFAVEYGRKMPPPPEPILDDGWDFTSESRLRELTDLQLGYFSRAILCDYGCRLQRDPLHAGLFAIRFPDGRTADVTDSETIQGVWDIVTKQTQ